MTTWSRKGQIYVASRTKVARHVRSDGGSGPGIGSLLHYADGIPLCSVKYLSGSKNADSPGGIARQLVGREQWLPYATQTRMSHPQFSRNHTMNNPTLRFHLVRGRIRAPYCRPVVRLPIPQIPHPKKRRKGGKRVNKGSTATNEERRKPLILLRFRHSGCSP